MSKQRRTEAPPPDHPLPLAWCPGGWTWDPVTGDYIPAQSTPEAAPEPPMLAPATEPTPPTEAP
jgi:hypothetical protein